MSAKNEKLDMLRHSTAHVMAEAVMKLFPGSKVAIGPSIENGFYYDFDLTRPIKAEDLTEIEKEMRRIVSGNHDFIREEVSKEKALELFKDQPYKIELINDLPADATISIYTQDGYTDLCRGPHIANTKEINPQSFKLMKIAGAYWRGDINRPMLTRIYGTAWEKPQQLKDYLNILPKLKNATTERLEKNLIYSTSMKKTQVKFSGTRTDGQFILS